MSLQEPRWLICAVFYDGKAWHGHCRLIGKRLEVSSAYGSRAVDCGRRRPDLVAGEVLRELVVAWVGR
jgi:hypothetical protein